MGKHVFGSLDPNSPKSANIQSLPAKYNSFRVPANAEHIIISNTSKHFHWQGLRLKFPFDFSLAKRPRLVI